MKAKIRVLCVDDHEIVRDGLSMIIGVQSDMEIAGLAATAKQARELFERDRPDVTLMDLRMTPETGVSAIRSIVAGHPSARIIALTMYQSVEAINEALKAGATTYLSKNTPSERLLWTIREVHAGRRPSPLDLVAALEERASDPLLTVRETEIISLVSQGLRNKEIAAALKITNDTVEVHLRHIFAKMKVNDRTAAVRLAVQRGIIDLM